MTIDAAINAYALSASGITDLIGNNLFPERAPREDQDVPYVVYHLEFKDEDPTLNGPVVLIEAALQFIVVAATYDSAFAIAEAFRVAFNYFKGVMGDVQVEQSSWEGTQGGSFPGQTAELGLFGALVKFTLVYVP